MAFPPFGTRFMMASDTTSNARFAWSSDPWCVDSRPRGPLSSAYACGDRIGVVEIIDQAVFTSDGLIRRLRAFWSEATIRVETP